MRLKARHLAIAFVALVAGCQTAEELAASDDALCRSYGAKRGSDAYVSCRVEQQKIRAIAAAQNTSCSAIGGTISCF